MSSSWAIIAIDVVVLLVTTMIDDVDVLIVGHYEEIRCQLILLSSSFTFSNNKTRL